VRELVAPDRPVRGGGYGSDWWEALCRDERCLPLRIVRLDGRPWSGLGSRGR